MENLINMIWGGGFSDKNRDFSGPKMHRNAPPSFILTILLKKKSKIKF